MTDTFYKKAFESALSELTGLSSQREALKKEIESLEERMDKVRKGALGLASLADIDFDNLKDKYPDLFEDEADPRLGLTDAIREVMKSYGDVMTPVQIKEGLYQITPAIAGHKSPMASIHAVLRRLMEKDEVLMGVLDDGKTVYGWIGTDEALKRITERFADGENIYKRRMAKRKKKK